MNKAYVADWNVIFHNKKNLEFCLRNIYICAHENQVPCFFTHFLAF